MAAASVVSATLLILSVMLAVSAQSLCPEDASVGCQTATDLSRGGLMMGGWAPQDIHRLPADIQVAVDAFVQDGLGRCVDAVQTSPVRLVSVHTQVVAGTNFCINLQVGAASCVIQAFRPLPGEPEGQDVKINCS